MRSYSVISGTPLVMNNTKLTRPAQSALFNTLATEQPRILATKERFLWLKQQYEAPGSNPVKTRVQSVLDAADNALAAATIDDRAIEALAVAWWVTGNSAYPERVWTDVQAVLHGHRRLELQIRPDELILRRHRAGLALPVLERLPPHDDGECDHHQGRELADLHEQHRLRSCQLARWSVRWPSGRPNETGAEALLYKAPCEGVSIHPQLDHQRGRMGRGHDVRGACQSLIWAAAMAGLESAVGSTWEYGNTQGFGLPAREQYYSKTNNSDWFTFSDIGISSKLGFGWLNWWARRFEKGESWAISRSRGTFAENVLMLTDETSPDHHTTQPPPDMYFRGPIDSTDGAFKEIVTLRGKLGRPERHIHRHRRRCR